MQFLMQTIVALLLLWNVSVSWSASTEKREFMAPIASAGADEDPGSDEISSNNRDVPSKRASRVDEEGGADEKEAQADRLSKSALSYGTVGYLPSEGIFLEFPLDEPQDLYREGPGLFPRRMLINDKRNSEQPEEVKRLDLVRSTLHNALLHRTRTSQSEKRPDAWSQGSNYPRRYYSSQPSFSGSQSSVIAPFRTAKRSPGCLRKCMAQGFLHPSQCHSLC